MLFFMESLNRCFHDWWYWKIHTWKFDRFLSFTLGTGHIWVGECICSCGGERSCTLGGGICLSSKIFVILSKPCCNWIYLLALVDGVVFRIFSAKSFVMFVIGHWRWLLTVGIGRGMFSDSGALPVPRTILVSRAVPKYFVLAVSDEPLLWYQEAPVVHY